MSKPFLIAFGVALLLLVGFLVLWSSPGHVEASGHIGKVRVQKVDDNESVFVIDFTLRNDSDRPRTVGSTSAHLDAADGSSIEAKPIASPDLANVFRNYPELGNQFNPAIKGMDEIGAHQSVNRSIGIRVDAPDDKIATRKDVVLAVQYINGPIVEMSAK